MLLKYLNENTINVEEECRNWEEVAYKAGALLVENDIVSEGYITDTIETVKKFGPYIILVPGIAFFHAEPSDAVKKIGISFITLENEIYFDEEKEKRIDCAFSFAAIDNESHLALLTELAGILKNKDTVEKLKSHPSKIEVLEILKNIDKGV